MNRYDRVITIDGVRRQPRADSSQGDRAGSEATAQEEADLIRDAPRFDVIQRLPAAVGRTRVSMLG